MDANFTRLLRRFLAYAGEGDLSVDARLRDLGLDSMRAIELLFAVEEEYDVIIPDDKLVDGTFETPGDLWAAVEELLRRREAGLA